MNLNIVLSQSLLQVVFISNILDLLQFLKTAKINVKTYQFVTQRENFNILHYFSEKNTKIPLLTM